MVMVWVITLRLQKVPRATTSRTEASRRCCWFILPMGNAMTPLSEAAYNMSLVALRTLRPVIFSGIEKLSLTNMFSESMMDRTGGVAGAAVVDVEVPVDAVEDAVTICA